MSALRFLAFFALPALCAADSLIDLLERNTIAKIRAFEQSMDGALGVAVIDLDSGREFGINGGVLFPQASSIKIPILIRAFQAERDGEFRLTDKVTLTSRDVVGGSGHLQKTLANGPMTLTIADLLTAMVETSDNTATNKLIDMVKMERVNRMLDEMGFLNTRLRRRMMDSDAVARGLENVSTPHEMARVVERIYRGRIVDEKASAAMIGILKKVKADIRKGVPEGVVVASKPGSVPGVKCETGIVYAANRPFIISVMSTFVDEKSTAIADVTRIVYAHLARLGHANEWGHAYR